MSRYDPTAPVRKGDELDVTALSDFLNGRVPGFEGELVVEQFPGGHSNLTYLLRTPARELVLRRPPPGAEHIVAGHDMLREFTMLSVLAPVFDKAPKPLLFCAAEGSPIGQPFCLMERVDGLVLRGVAPAGVDLRPERMQALGKSFAETLAALHALDPATPDLASISRPTGYLERQVSGWTRRYRNARTDEVAAMERVAGWLEDAIPQEQAPAIVHNDFKYDNLVVDPADVSRIRAVLDWEMATVGDPLTDLGTALAYWVEPTDDPELKALGLGLTTIAGNPTRDELVEMYAEASGRDITNMGFYRVLGLFKVAVIAQQIYFRYRRGDTHDPRFERFEAAVVVLARRAEAEVAEFP